MLSHQSQLNIQVMGNFFAARPDGSEVRFAERRGQALIAILAVSDRNRKSRHWLKATLWPRSPEPQCSNSLRQTLHTIRRSLGPSARALQADRSHVWLDSVRIQRDRPSPNALFFEDAPELDEPFEDWLRQQRANTGDTSKISDLSQRRAGPCLGILPPIVKASSTGAEGLAKLVSDQIVDSLIFHEIVDVFDLRDMSTNQVWRFDLGEPPSIELLGRLSLIEAGGGQQLGFQVQDAHTKKVIWSMSLQAEIEGAFHLDLEQFADFTAQVVDSIHNAVARVATGSRRGVMLAAVHQLISHSIEGQNLARKMLNDYHEDSGLSHAWAAYTFAVAHGERHAKLGPRELEQAEYHCRRSVEVDPSNPLARALVAHVSAFVLKHYVEAEEHVAVAMRSGPGLAMTWRSSALLAHYTGKGELARERSLKSHRLGQFSPYQGIYSTCHLFASSTSGNFKEAISLGERILRKRPGYLAAMRHLSACYALDGHAVKANELIKDIQKADPLFTPKGIRDARYPLPAGRSVDLISQGFAALGVYN